MDFEAEFKEFHTFVEQMTFTKISPLVTQVVIVTLEGTVLNLECHTSNGIKVNNQSYECMEQILTKYSPLYVQKFNEELFAKLSKLEQE
jgi:hypothetical protein